jgi:hypothetical protein
MIALAAALLAQQAPSLDGPWRRLAAPPKLERFGTGREQTVDFTVFRSKDGAWHLVSCVRQTAHPGGGRLLYRWESGDLEAENWEPKGIFLTSDPALGHREGVVQAPHGVVEDGVWWFFFSSDGARAMTSPDGRDFRPAAGGAKLFDMGRDVGLLDNRARDGLWYAFFTDVRPGRFPERRDHTVAYRTAPRLAGPWSPEKPDVGVLTPPPPGYLFAYAESPFVHFRRDRYFRFEQLHVYASSDPARWSGPPVAVLSGRDALEFLSPEIVEHEGRTWIAAYRDHGRAGIWLAPLAWK